MALLEDQVVVLAELPGPPGVRVALPPGTTLPATRSAAGQLLIAAREPGQLASVRRHAAAQVAGDEWVELAVPVCPDGVTPVAALSLHVPRQRWAEGRSQAWLTSLRFLAAQISHRLGAPVYRPYAEPTPSMPAESHPLSPAEREAFLQGPWAARLACLRPDGQPHVVPVWYEWRQRAFFVAAWSGYPLKTELEDAQSEVTATYGIGWQTREQWQALHDMLWRYRALARPVDVSQVFTTDFSPAP